MPKPFPKEEQKQIALIVLRAIEHLKTGKIKLASFLRGSQSQLVKEIDREMGYGALLWYDILTIKGFITQLEEMEFIKPHIVQSGNYSYPILILSEAGKKAIEDKIEIPLQIRKEVKPVSIGDSEKETLALFKKGIPPAEIAKRRELVVSTIYTHFCKLIEVGELSAKQCISDEIIRKVLKANKHISNKSSLKELKQMLPDISYEEIRIVLADKNLR